MEGAAKAAEERVYFFPFFPHRLMKVPKTGWVKTGRGHSLPDFSG